MKLYCAKCNRIFESSKKCGDGEDICPKCGWKVAVPAAVTADGAVIGDFRIVRPISSGGMGEVYLAHQISLDRPAALKVLQQKFVDDKEYVESLFREARLAAKLNHPNIVQAYAVGEDDGIYYFAMEYVEGETFKQVLKQKKVLDFDQAAKVICEIAGAINTAWTEQKLVHQDIKPDNIMLAANGKAKLADLGLCQIATGSDPVDDGEDEVLGTPQYISPEQLTGVPTDVRSDIYSLGATFFQFVTGRFPYVADNADDIARMHVAGNLEPPKKFNPELPDELNNIIVKMMARDIDKRYQSAADLVQDLSAFLNRKKDPAAVRKTVPSLNLKKNTAAASKAVPALKVPPRAAAPAVPPLSVSKAAPAVPPPAAPPAPDAAADTAKAVDAPAAAEPEAEVPAVDENAVTAPTSLKFSIPGGKTTVIAVAAAAGVLIVFAVVLYLCHINIIPEPVCGYGKKVLALAGVGKVPAAGTTVKVPQKKTPAAPAPRPAVPPKPKTRPEYIAAIRKVIDMPRGTTFQQKRFHQEAEKILFAVWNGSNVPVTLEEQQMVNMLSSFFAPVDDNLFFVSGRERESAKRNAAIRVYQEKLEAARRAEEERKEAEARRAEEERRRREAERLQAEEEQKRFEAQRLVEQQRRLRELQKNVAEHSRGLCSGFYAAAVKGDFEALDSAVRDAGAINDIEIGDSSAEKKLAADFRAFRSQLVPEAKKLRAFVECVEKLNEDAGLVVSYGKEFATIVSVKAGDGARGKLANGKIVPVKLADAKLRRAFFRGLGRYAQQEKRVRAFLCTSGRNSDRVRDNNTEFYYSLMNAELSPAVQKKAPAGFWKRFAGFFAKNASREMIKR